MASRRIWGYATSVVAPALLTGALLPMHPTLNLTSDALLFLLLAVLTAVCFGLGPALLTVVIGSVLLNYFFTEPRLTLTVADPNNALALVVFLTVTTIVSIGVDLVSRHRRQLDEASATEVALTQANRLRTALLAAVGHDLRTPLAVAKASVSSLRSADLELSSGDERELLAEADDALERLTALVNNLLDMSRLQAGALVLSTEPTDLEELLNRSLDDVGQPSLRVALAPGLPNVGADPGLLERAVVNVLSNALRHSPPGIPPRIEADQHDGQVAVRIIDHGPGVPDAELDQLFLPFHRASDTTPHSGLGLGLALSRGLIEAMGGSIAPERTAGGGLTMFISLPVAAVDATEPGRRERGSEPS